MSQRYTLVVLAAVIGLAGCALFQIEPDDLAVDQSTADSPPDQVARMMDQIEELRGRQFDPRPAIGEGQPEGFDTRPVPEPVEREWQWFRKMLFGGDEATLVADDPRWASRVGLDQRGGQLTFDGDPRDDETAAFAVAMGASQMLEQQLFEPLDAPETVDEWLTRAIVERAGAAFAASVVLAEQFEQPLTIDELAERPELAVHIPGVGPGLGQVRSDASLTQIEAPPEGMEYFEESLHQFVLRKSLSVGSALYRSGGWPAVEWGRSEPASMTDYLVRLESWFDGDGTAQWTWPDELENSHRERGWDKQREGRVGPAITALWLEGLVGAQAARTIYGGWRDDAYRIYTRDVDDESDEEAVFHWVTAWQTPHDAQEIASAMEAVLGHFLGHEHRGSRFRVAVSGLTVGVTIYERDQNEQLVTGHAELVAGAGPGFIPDEQAPFEYEPPLYQRYVEAADEATMDLEVEEWIDPAAGWHTAIDSLQGWTVQRSNEPHVRWFATHPDGTLIQWTTELLDPVEAEFGSGPYLESLAERFAQSVDAQREPTVEVVDRPVEQTVRLQVTGRIDDRPQQLQLWQFTRGDVLVSFSVQGPEGFFGERLDEARAVLNRMEPFGEPIERREADPQPDPAEDEGIIEFEVGEE